jgi:GNAT superfamily N-acetyltransferase
MRELDAGIRPLPKWKAMTLNRIDRLTESQIEDLYQMYQGEWWCKGRTRQDIRRMLERCPIIVAFADPSTGKLAAFARAITDFVYKAVIFDVIVAPDYRTLGLGRELMEAIVDHPALKSVEHLELYCLPELVPFYERLGFTADLGRLKFMRRSLKAP